MRELKLNEQDKQLLQSIERKGKHSARKIKRAKVLLLLDSGKTIKETTEQTGLCPATIVNIKKRYFEVGSNAAIAVEDKPRPGQPPKITPKVEAHLTAIACSEAPDGRSRWTLDMLTDKLISLKYVDTISREAVRKSLKKANSNPGKRNNGASAK